MSSRLGYTEGKFERVIYTRSLANYTASLYTAYFSVCFIYADVCAGTNRGPTHLLGISLGITCSKRKHRQGGLVNHVKLKSGSAVVVGATPDDGLPNSAGNHRIHSIAWSIC